MSQGSTLILFTVAIQSATACLSTDHGGLPSSSAIERFIELIWSSIARVRNVMEYPVDRVRLARQPPIHPGIIFGDTVMPELRKDRTIAEIAALLGVSRATLHRVIAGAVAISVDMAVRIAKLCGGEPELWLDLQTDYDTFRAKKRLARELERIPSIR